LILFFFVVPTLFRTYPEIWYGIIGVFGDDPLYIFMGSAFCCHFLIWITCNGLLGFLYWAQIPAVEKFKTIQSEPWPWNHPKEEMRKEFWKMFWQALALIAFNNVFISIPQTYFGYYAAKERGLLFSQSFDDFPSVTTILWQIGTCMLIEDFMFYWGHRFLHIPVLFRNIHKVHHKFHTTIGIASEGAHPIEFYIGNILPFTTGPALLQVHLFTFWMWFIFRIAKTSDAHGGYSFPFSPFTLIPLTNPAAAHDYHHSTGFTSCYGSFLVIWDTLMGTNKDYIASCEKKKNKQLSPKKSL